MLEAPWTSQMNCLAHASPDAQLCTALNLEHLNKLPTSSSAAQWNAEKDIARLPHYDLVVAHTPRHMSDFRPQLLDMHARQRSSHCVRVTCESFSCNLRNKQDHYVEVEEVTNGATGRGYNNG